MIKNKIITGLLFVLISGGALAQDFAFPEVKGYKKVTDYPVFVPDNLWDFIDGAADAYLALGFIDLHVAEYKKGKESIKVEIYKHSNNTMAFGIYSSERSSGYRFMNLGAQGYTIEGSINFFKGCYYVKIRTYSKKEKTLQAVQSLAYRVSEMLDGDAVMPSLLSEFPADGKIVNEETFINESVLGHQFIEKAFKATYKLGDNNFAIFLKKTDSLQETLKTIVAYLKSVGRETDESESGKYVFNDGYNGTIFLSWKDDKIVIISGLAKDQTDLAETYTSEILK